jgi:outer membrane lipoprotein-sorting protein
MRLVQTLIHPLLLACVLALSALSAFAQQTPAPPTAAAIMARVAANQDKAETARAHYVVFAVM